MKYLIILFLVSGCGMDSYNPTVENPSVKYEDDLRNCIEYSKESRTAPNIGKSIFVGATGLAGYVILEANKSKDDDYFKDGYQLTDECLAKKGYNLTHR